jgi:hypothetical protein
MALRLSDIAGKGLGGTHVEKAKTSYPAVANIPTSEMDENATNPSCDNIALKAIARHFQRLFAY